MKEFFNNAKVKATAWVVLIAADAVLLLGGATADDLGKAGTLTAAVIVAVSAVVAFVSSHSKKSDE